MQSRLASHRTDYLQRASLDELTWAEQLARVARQTESFHRATKGTTKPTPHDPRDSAMAVNALWVMERERSRGRVVLLTHNFHVSAQRGTGPFVAARFKQLGGDAPVEDFDSMGFMLRERVGRAYATLGTAFSVDDGDSAAPAADSTSVDGTLARVGPQSFLLDVRNAPRVGSATWLDSARRMRAQGDYVRVVPRLSFDGILFVDRIHDAARSSSPPTR